MTEPGPLVGRGRAADVYDLGDGRVLRRYREERATPDFVEREAAAMRHLAAAGFPVPEVYDAAGRDLVMEHLDGVSMLTDLERRPWRLRRHGDLWAELHRRLAAVPVDGLAGLPVRFGPPEAVLHLDFHPDNIMLTSRGPVVIDWSNVALGPAAADVAQSWIIGATSSVDAGGVAGALVRLFRGRMIDRFVDACGRADAIALVPAVAEQRLQDPNVRPEEAARIRALVAGLAR
jgi:Ser/Thr protein kinase RdoA (MazF antagonist)